MIQDIREKIVRQLVEQENQDLAEMLYGLDPDKYEIVYQIGKEPRIELK